MDSNLVSYILQYFKKKDKSENILAFTVAAQEAVKVYQDQLESVKSLKDTEKTLFSSTSLIFALNGAVQAFNPPDSLTCTYKITGLLLLLAFAIFIYLSIRVLLPIKLVYPFKATWENFDTYIMEKENDKEVYKIITLAYLEAVEKNEPLLLELRKKIVLSGIFMVIVVCLLVILLLV